jgi:hypothetical protein
MEFSRATHANRISRRCLCPNRVPNWFRPGQMDRWANRTCRLRRTRVHPDAIFADGMVEVDVPAVMTPVPSDRIRPRSGLGRTGSLHMTRRAGRGMFPSEDLDTLVGTLALVPLVC